MGSRAEDERSPGRATLWIAIAAIVIVVGGWMVVPGVDSMLLDEVLAGGGADLRLALIPVIGLGLGILVGARLALAFAGKTKSGLARMFVLAAVLALAAIQALAIAFWAESLSASMPFGDLVAEPGWRFRLTAMLTVVGGVAVVWWLADRIDASRAVTGAVAVALLASFEGLPSHASAIAQAIASGERAPMSALLALALPASMLLAAIGLAVWTPRSWPVKIGAELELRSSFDVVAAPCVISVLVGSAIGTASLPLAARAALVVAGSVGVVALLRARVTERAQRRALWPIAVALASFALALAPLGWGLTSSGWISRSLEPGPLEGEASFTLTLAAEDRFRSGEAQAMADRLSELGAEAEVVMADERRIRIRVERASDPESVADAIRPHRVALHLVREPPVVAAPPGVRAASSHTRAWEGACDAMRAWAETVGCTAAVEPLRETGEPMECRLYCLEPEAVVTGADIADAQVTIDPYGGQPMVSATLVPAAAERFERVTGENVERQLAIVVDGEVASAPVIRSAIPGGQIQITLGALASYEELLLQANVLASALRAGDAITSEWALESID